MKVLSKRVPFVMSSVIDFKEHYTGSEKTVDQLDYLAITAGLECIVDPKLKSALVMQCGKFCTVHFCFCVYKYAATALTFLRLILFVVIAGDG